MLRVSDSVSVKVGDWDRVLDITVEGSNPAISDIAEEFSRNVVLTLEEALEIIKARGIKLTNKVTVKERVYNLGDTCVTLSIYGEDDTLVTLNFVKDEDLYNVVVNTPFYKYCVK